MDSLPISLWIAIAGLVALLSLWTMGAFWSKNQMPVEGKTVLITGASEGMGRSVARQMAEKGANVILVSRSVPKLEEAMAEAQAAACNPSQRFHYITADVSKPDYAPSLLAEAVEWNNGQALDIVWCVAGKSTPDFWVEAPLSLTRNQMDINFWGSAEMAHAILRLWLAPNAPVVTEPKHLIFTSSVVAFFPVVGYGPYTPAKSALRGLADTLLQEVQLYPQKVKIHVVYPGSISSPGFERENKTKPEITNMIEDGDPVQSPDEVAAASIRGLEKGYYFITVAFLGHVLRWSALGGSTRSNILVDTVMGWVIGVAMLVAGPLIHRQIRQYGKKHGHPVNYRKKGNDDLLN
ncbi:Uu.00g004140.m01.CDS01 [Anthostomella pinea]|uniref:3-dehydrosphinganine reductase n=1 Tax=Anthostomella pinea TaxID=933095 RepID=A0AAI8YGD1_9PEZI|nr:Uu.00g004140.m01.CDS01 [Anthostomella pinea]